MNRVCGSVFDIVKKRSEVLGMIMKMAVISKKRIEKVGAEIGRRGI